MLDLARRHATTSASITLRTTGDGTHKPLWGGKEEHISPLDFNFFNFE